MTSTATIETSTETLAPQAADALWVRLTRNAHPRMLALMLNEMTSEQRAEVWAGEERFRYLHMHCEIGARCCS